MKTFKDLSKIVGLCFVVVLGLYFTAKQFESPLNHDYKVIIITGLEGPAKWVPSLCKKLDENHFAYSVINIHKDKSGRLNLIETLREIDREIKKSNQKIILVGHSLGGRVELILFDSYDLGRKVIGGVLISTPLNETKNSKKHNEGYTDFFYEMNLSKFWDKKFIVLHSTDDEIVPYSDGLELSKKLKAELKTFDDRGHISSENDFNKIYNAIYTVRL